MKAPTTRHRRAGFTLIELLMVIFLIGILATILGFAANKALMAARRARILSEIDQLNTAVETFKNDAGGAYPPTWGRFIDETPQQKQQRITKFLAKRFPRFNGGYAGMRSQVSLSTRGLVAAANGLTPGAITLIASGTAGGGASDGGLDIENLDPAETLVFWLGGIPNPMAENKLAGFRADVTSPFLDPQNMVINAADPNTLTGRTTPVFPFQPSRLVDRDRDGWWEYLPAGARESDLGPPLVYFDNLVYPLGVCYPQTGPGGFTPVADQQALATNASTWGAVAPYANEPAVPNVRPLTWQKSQAFQIVSAGLDGFYNPNMIPTNMTTAVPFFPLEYHPSGMGFVEQENDNLTNFYQGPLGDAFQ